MANYCKLEQFTGNDFESYLERVELFLEASDLSPIAPTADNAAQVAARNSKRRAVFLSVIGAEAYTTIRKLVAPAKPNEKTYDQLTQALKDHYYPTASKSVARFSFHTRVRQHGESIADFVSDLRKLAEKCEFEENFEDMLCDRLLCGVNDNAIQNRLLTEKDLTFKKAFEIALAQELATKNVKILQGAEVNAVKTKRSKKTQSTKQEKTETKSKKTYCFRCGNPNHLADKCTLSKSIVCHFCKKEGHMAKVCLKKKKGEGKIYTANSTSEDVANVEQLLTVDSKALNVPWTVTVDIEGKLLPFQVDTGASVSVMNIQTFHHYFPDRKIQPSKLKLGSYSGHSIQVAGECLLRVHSEEGEKKLILYVVHGDGPTLLGREWLRELKCYNVLNTLSDPEDVVSEFPELFRTNTLGLLKTFKAKFEVDKQVKPVFCKARPVPIALKRKVEEELHRLESLGVIRKTVHSDWAAPVVPVLKRNGKIRLCGDYKMTINQAILKDNYPLPVIDEILAQLAGGSVYSKLDLSQAYHQIALEESTMHLTTINTHCGLYEYLRLPFGASPCVGIFQRAMENVLRGLSGVHVFLDDILVTGKTREEHLNNLKQVFAVLQDNGLKLQREKCQFFLTDIPYLGFRITTEGLKPSEDKVEAITKAKSPHNVSELRSVIGLVSYYSRFIPNLAHRMSPLYQLLRKEAKWKWTKVHEDVFAEIKRIIASNPVLAHYDLNSEIVLTCDASAVGVGAVMEKRLPDGSTQPIAFASRSLSDAEKNYAQIEREALGIIFGVQKFRQYLLGRTFTLRTDHKPLTVLFGDKKETPQLASARIKRWALILSAYSYSIEYIGTKQNGCADFLSRMPLNDDHQGMESQETSEEILAIEQLNEVPLTATAIAHETMRDPILSKVLHLTKEGWMESCHSEDLRPYFVRRSELSVEQNCLLWGARVIVPQVLRSQLLLDLHQEHLGIARMKSRARQYFWWPAMDDAITDVARKCVSCLEHSSLPPQQAAKWNWPTGPWKRLHIDYAGPFMGKMFLVIVDSYSKWLDVFPLQGSTSEITVSCLRKLFSEHGLPEQVVSDNGPQFTSSEFQTFMHQNGIQHTTTAPGHPATNGLAERYVGFLKAQLKKNTENIPLGDKLSRILFAYRTTPQPATGEAPCQLLMKRKLRTRFSLLYPSLEGKKNAEVLTDNLQSKCVQFEIGDTVWALNLRNGPKWCAGVVVGVQYHNYFVEVNSQIWKRHANQLKKRVDMEMHPASQIHSPTSHFASLPCVPPEPEVAVPVHPPTPPTPEVVDPVQPSTQTHTTQPRRNPPRNRRPPERLDL